MFLNHSNENICLIITGCISPVQQKYLVLTNTEERLKQYIDSIEYYIKKSNFKKIVFCDNSNYSYKNKNNIYNMATKMGKEFEWLAFSGNVQKTVNQGKGYGEGEIIEYALKNSVLLKSCDYFAKVTGRLIITNINEILKNISLKYYEVFMNADIYRKRGIDTRFYIIQKNRYVKEYINIYKKVNDNIVPPLALEDLFYLKTERQKNRWHNIFPFPRFVGVSGGNGRNYAKESKKILRILDFLCENNRLKKIPILYYYGLRIKQRIK